MSDAIRQQIDAANRGFVEAVGRGDVEAATQVYTDDATILPPGHKQVTGRSDITAFWAGAAQQLGISGAMLRTTELEVIDDRTAYELGEFRLDGASGPIDEGKYVVVWRQSNGTWHWHVDIWNSNRSPQ